VNNSVRKVSVTLLFYLQTRYELFCCACFYQSALCRLCAFVLYSRVFAEGNVRYPVWTCRVSISLILGTRFSILDTQIGSLKRLNKSLDLCLLQNLKIKQIHQEIHLFYNLFKVRGAWAKGKLL